MLSSFSLCTQAYSENASILPTGSLVDGALTPVNSPAATLSRRQQAAADISRLNNMSWNSVSANESSQQWQAAIQQPITAQSNVSRESMQEMDSLLAAEKVLFHCYFTVGINVYGIMCPSIAWLRLKHL